ncbi:hypothetical protein [Ekhidna sp.]|uniref:hypothetical protein n=1 Tax=Ekhidna sp. TaxID=2608089 RepID=UPI003B510EF7
MHVFTSISKHGPFIIGLVLLLMGFATYTIREIQLVPHYLLESIPSFLHTAAFSLITYNFARHLKVTAIQSCSLWVVINTVCEQLQQTNMLGGIYDANDIIFSILGGALSYSIIKVYKL